MNNKDTIWDNIINGLSTAKDVVFDFAEKMWKTVSEFCTDEWAELKIRFFDNPSEKTYVLIGIIVVLLGTLIFALSKSSKKNKDWYENEILSDDEKLKEIEAEVAEIRRDEGSSRKNNKAKARLVSPRGAVKPVAVRPIVMYAPAERFEEDPDNESAAVDENAGQAVDASEVSSAGQAVDASEVSSAGQAVGTSEVNLTEQAVGASEVNLTEQAVGDSEVDSKVKVEQIQMIKAVPARKYGPDNQDTNRSGRIFTEEELKKIIKE